MCVMKNDVGQVSQHDIIAFCAANIKWSLEDPELNPYLRN